MKKMTFLLFTSLLTGFLIIGCGDSDSDSDSGSSDAKNVNIPGGGSVSTIVAGNPDTSPPVISGCEDSTVNLPGCN